MSVAGIFEVIAELLEERIENLDVLRAKRERKRDTTQCWACDVRKQETDDLLLIMQETARFLRRKEGVEFLRNPEIKQKYDSDNDCDNLILMATFDAIAKAMNNRISSLEKKRQTAGAGGDLQTCWMYDVRLVETMAVRDVCADAMVHYRQKAGAEEEAEGLENE